MKKRGVSGVITVVLFIIIVILLVMLIYVMTKRMIKSSAEVSEAKTQLITEQVYIKAVNTFDSSQINITLNRGGAKEIIKNYTLIKGESKLVDVFSVVDLSYSMIGSKINSAKLANIAFVKSILNNSGNRVGFKAYQTIYMPGLSHSLSNNTVSLESVITSWSVSGSTCICCGINQAKSDLIANSTSDKLRVMVVMSDGQANIGCSEQNTGNAKQDAINASCMANSAGITVYTIGFGDSSDTATLQAIANCGGGAYYDSTDVSKLSEIYTQIADKITANYEGELKYYLKIVFYNKTNSYTYNLPNPPQPLETITYSIPLNNQITNITKIEIYPVIMTESGTHVIGNILDTWKAK